MKMLTDRTSFEEMTITAHADLQDENRQQALMVLDDLIKTAKIKDQISDLFGAKVIVHSGYRCKPLNDAVGSQDNSQHLLGQAFDFHVVGLEDQLRACLDKIVQSDILYHQLLIEGACLHLGTFRPNQKNMEVAWWAEGEKVIYREAVG